MRKIFRLLFCVALLLLASAPVLAREVRILGASSLSTAERIAEIRKDWRESKPSYASAIYTSSPSLSSFRQGTLRKDYLEDALSVLNFIRRTCGLSDVQLHGPYNESCQYGALLIATSDYSHTPRRPKGMPSSTYQKGYENTLRSNLASGYQSLADAIMKAWVSDSDAGNIPYVSHRRWLLNPSMGRVGFGQVANKTTMYVHDESARLPDYEAICYPASGAFPRELMGGDYPFTISLNPDKFLVPNKSRVSVEIEHINTGRKWKLSSSSSAAGGAYFGVSDVAYGVPYCLIFRPGDVYLYDGTFRITVNGLKYRGGQAAELSYSVNFFALNKENDALLDQNGYLNTAPLQQMLIDSISANPQKKVHQLHVQGAHRISQETMEALNALATRQGVQCQLLCDTLVEGKRQIQGRIVVDLWRASARNGFFRLEVYTREHSEIDAARILARQWFKRPVAIVYVEQFGHLGAPMRISAPVDLGSMKRDSLYFYAFDKDTQALRQITDPAYSADANGFLHFKTNRGGAVIISDRIANI